MSGDRCLSEPRRLGIALMLLAAGSGCATTRLWRSAGSPAADAVVLNVEGLRQTGSNCGPNALAMLLAAAGDPVPEQEIAAVVQNSRLNSALTIDLVLYARSRGHNAHFATGSLESLRDVLSRGHPALLLLDLSASIPLGLGPDHLWHYVVAYGFSESKGRVYVHSGVGRKYLNDRDLVRLWAPSGWWMMTITQRDGLVAG